MRETTKKNRYTRRSVLHGGLSAALAAGVAPSLLYADKAGAKETVIGEGEHRYRCEHDWGMKNLPDGHEYGWATHGVAVDKAGHVYVTHYGNPASIFVFDPDGKFVRSMRPQDKDGNHMGGHGIDIREENGQEFIYLAPSVSNLSFVKIDLAGEVAWSRGKAELIEQTKKYTNKTRYRATNVSFTPDGGYCLGDGYGSSYIHQFDKDDKYLRTLDGSEIEKGRFRTAHSSWLDDRDGTPKIVVCDRENYRLRWYDLNGKHLSMMKGFDRPADFDTRGDLMIVPELLGRIAVLDKDNTIVTRLGAHGEFKPWRDKLTDRKYNLRGKRAEWEAGRFVHPHDACFDADGNIYVTEYVQTGRVTKLTRVG